MSLLTGQKRGKLTIGNRVGTVTLPSQTFGLYECECECGVVVQKDSRYFGKVKIPMCDNCREDSRSRYFPKFSTADDDLRLIKWRKHPCGYAITGGGNDKKRAHTIVIERMIGRKLRKDELCDHINRNKLDNRRENLRVADKSLNTINRGMRPDNTTGYIGVRLYWPKEYRERGWAKRWNYVIWRRGQKTIYSKMYKSPEEANKARLEYLTDNNIY